MDLTVSYDSIGHDIDRVVSLLDESELIRGETDSSAIRASVGFSRGYSINKWLLELRGHASWRRFETSDYTEQFGESSLAQVSGGAVSVTPVVSNRLSVGLVARTLWRPPGWTVMPELYLFAQSDNDRSSRIMTVKNQLTEVDLQFVSEPRSVSYLNAGIGINSILNQTYGFKINFNRYFANNIAGYSYIHAGFTAYF